jgi:hypothetical protein
MIHDKRNGDKIAAFLPKFGIDRDLVTNTLPNKQAAVDRKHLYVLKLHM